MPLIEEFYGKKKMLGVCLGMQAIAEFHDMNLSNLSEVKHGIQSNIDYDSDSVLYREIEGPMKVGHYHSILQ